MSSISSFYIINRFVFLTIPFCISSRISTERDSLERIFTKQFFLAIYVFPILTQGQLCPPHKINFLQTIILLQNQLKSLKLLDFFLHLLIFTPHQIIQLPILTSNQLNSLLHQCTLLLIRLIFLLQVLYQPLDGLVLV